MSADELFEIIDESGRPKGVARRGEVHGNPALIHRSVHVLVVDRAGQLYLQKRSPEKDIQPGKWDTSVGGHVGLGESPETAARREMAEELGLEGPGIEFIYGYLWRSDVETELVSSYLCRYEGEIRIDREEISEGRWWSFTEIEASLGGAVFTPNFEEEFSRLKGFLAQKKAQ